MFVTDKNFADFGRTNMIQQRGLPFGMSRTGPFNALGGFAWGSQIPLGRIAVYSPYFNKAKADGAKPDREFSLPDATGAYLVNPHNGLPLDDTANADLLAAAKVGGVYLLGGIVINGNRCDTGKCFQPQGHPITYPDYRAEWAYVQDGSGMTVLTHGAAYLHVGEDVQEGDLLSFVDVSDSTDPAVATRYLGSAMKAGNGVQDLPGDYVVMKDATADSMAEVSVGGFKQFG